MPQIPQYFSQAPVSTESANALAPMGLASDLSGPNLILSKALEGIKNDFEAIQVERQKTQDMLDLATADNAMTDKTFEFKKQFKDLLDKGVDEEGNPVDYKKVFEDFQNKYDELIDGIKASPAYNDKVKARLLISAANERQKDLVHGYTLLDTYRVRDQQETFLENFESFKAKGEIGKALATVKGAIQGKLITMPQAKQYENEVYTQHLQSYLDNYKSQYGLEGAYKYVTENKQDILTITDDKGVPLHKVPESVVNSFLSQTRMEINLQKKERDEAETEAYNSVANKVFSLMVNNQITSANIGELNKQIASLPIKGTQKMDLANKVKSFVENGDSFHKTTDHNLWIDLNKRVDENDPTLTNDEISKYAGKGLSATDVVSLMNKNTRFKKDGLSTDDEIYKDAKNHILDQIEFSDEYGLEKGSVKEKQFKAKKLLDQLIQEGKEKGKTLSELLIPRYGDSGQQLNQNYIGDQIIQKFADSENPTTPQGLAKLTTKQEGGKQPGGQTGKESSSVYLPWEHPNWEAAKMTADDALHSLTLSNIQSNLVAAGETIGNLVTGMAAFPLQVAGKVAGGPEPQKLDKENWRRIINESLIKSGEAINYKPMTEQGKELKEIVDIPFKAIGWVENKMGELAKDNPRAFNMAKVAVSGMMPVLWPIVNKIDTPEEREWVTKTSFELGLLGLPVLSSVFRTKILPKDIPELAKNLNENPKMVEAVKKEIYDNQAQMKEGVVGSGEILGEKPAPQEIIGGEKASSTAPVEMLMEKEPFLLTAEEKLALQNVRQPVKEIITDLATLFKDQRGSFSFEKLSPEQKAIHERLVDNLKFVQHQLGKKGDAILESLGKLNLDEKTLAFARQIVEENQKTEKKYAGSINLTKQDIPEMAKAIEMQAAESVLPKKRQTWAETDKRSDAILEDYKKSAEALKNIKGIKNLTVDIDAARKINSGAVGRLKEILDEGDPLKFQQEFNQYKEDVFKVVSQGSGEIGRALNAHKKTVGLESMGKAFANLERDLNPRELAELKKLNIDNPLEIKRFVERLGDPKLSEYFYEYWYNSILSGVPTHLINVASNTGWMSWQIPHRAMVAGVDKLVSTFTGKQREYFLDEVVPMMAGMKEGFSKGREGVWEMMKTGEITEYATKWDKEIGENIAGAFERSPHEGLRKIAPYLTAPTRVLRAMDVWANSIAYDAQIRALARREGLKRGLSGDALKDFESNPKNITPEMMTNAEAFAKYATFVDDPGKIVSWFIQGRNKIPFARIFVPFINTVANLTKRGVEMTPGLGLTLAKGQPWQEVVAKQIEGVLISLPILKKIASGEITGSAPTAQNEREAFYRQGKIPWGIKFGDTWYSFRRIEPFNTVIASTAMAYDAIAKAKDDDTKTEIFGNIVNGIVDNLLDSSYLQGVTNILDKYGSRKGWAQRTSASLFPFSGFWRSLNKAIEAATEGSAKVRDTKSLLGAFSQVIPGLSKAMPAKFNVWGEEIELQGGVFRQWLPYKLQTENPDKVEQVLEELKVYPGMPGRHVTINKDKVELPDDLYRDYCIYFGHKAKDALDKLVDNPKIDEAIQENPEAVKSKIDSLLTKIRNKTLLEVKREYLKTQKRGNEP